MSQTVILASGNITPFSHLTGSLAPLFPFCGLSKKGVLGPKLLLVMGCVKLGEKIAFTCLLWVNKLQINYLISRNPWEVIISAQ